LCDSNCKTCVNLATECKTCFDDKVVNGSDVCVCPGGKPYLYKHNGANECLTEIECEAKGNFYGNNIHGHCDECDSNCKKCF